MWKFRSGQENGQGDTSRSQEVGPGVQENDFTSQLLRYYAFARHPLGRWWLRIHVQYQRLRAQWLANGTSFVKRGVDIIISFALLLLFSPLFLVIAILVKLEDGGPVFF